MNGTSGPVNRLRFAGYSGRPSSALIGGVSRPRPEQGGPAMTHPSPDPGAAQFPDLFRSLVLDPELIFRRVLTTEHIAAAVAREVGRACDRVFTPLVTLATFLAQVLGDDHSCR